MVRRMSGWAEGRRFRRLFSLPGRAVIDWSGPDRAKADLDVSGARCGALRTLISRLHRREPLPARLKGGLSKGKLLGPLAFGPVIHGAQDGTLLDTL